MNVFGKPLIAASCSLFNLLNAKHGYLFGYRRISTIKHLLSIISAVQCERKPLILPSDQSSYQTGKNKTISLDYQSSDESEEDKKLIAQGSPSISSSELPEEEDSRPTLQCSISTGNGENINSGDDTNENIDVESVICVSNGYNDLYNKSCDLQQPVIISRFPEFVFEPPYISITDTGYLHEVATRLLFATMDWIQMLPSFQHLNEQDRYKLILNNWEKCFIVSMVQCAGVFPLSRMLLLAIGRDNSRDVPQPKSSDLRWGTFVKLKDIIMNCSLESMKELYDYIKLILLFDKGNFFSCMQNKQVLLSMCIITDDKGYS